MQPANLPESLGMRADGLVVLVNTRDVAELFEKPHDKVCCDIKALDMSPELATSWFRQTTTADSYGREQPSYDMTRDGFTLLVMGWTGPKAQAASRARAYIARKSPIVL